MTDEEFYELSRPYFKRRYFDLHTGCCLLAKVDPESEGFVVGDGFVDWEEQDGDGKDYDYTQRPFTVALRAINSKTLEELTASKVKPLVSVRRRPPNGGI